MGGVGRGHGPSAEAEAPEVSAGDDCVDRLLEDDDGIHGDVVRWVLGEMMKMTLDKLSGVEAWRTSTNELLGR